MSDRSQLLRQRLWRWHFIAGLVVCPFAILLSITGAIYLFKPQAENYEETAINALAPMVEQGTQSIAPGTQIKTLLAANPGSSFKRLILDKPGDRSLEIELQNPEGKAQLFWVDTLTGQVLASKVSDQRFMYLVKKLHSELLLGNAGSYVVELMASWLIILVVSGLYLWLSKPENKINRSQVVVPKLKAQPPVKKMRSLHSVVGVWFTLPIIVLLLTGLPWTQLWGSGFDRVKDFAGISGPGQQWFVTLKSKTPEANTTVVPESSLWQISDSSHEGHDHHAHHGSAPGADVDKLNLLVLNSIRNRAEVLQMVHPVQVVPPKPDNGVWTLRSMTPQRSERQTIHYDQHSGEQIMRIEFHDHHPVERFVSNGVSLHEGALFGWFNQLLGVLTALAIICISCFGLYAWWLRKPEQTKSGSTAAATSPGFIAMIILFGLLLPAAGISFLLIFLFEWIVSRVNP
ncbi:MAG: PepSY-associated TM helix domain-containing protein [Porticoccaceae bacterium]